MVIKIFLQSTVNHHQMSWADNCMYSKFYLLTLFDRISIYMGFRVRVWDEVGGLYAPANYKFTLCCYISNNLVLFVRLLSTAQG